VCIRSEWNCALQLGIWWLFWSSHTIPTHSSRRFKLQVAALTMSVFYYSSVCEIYCHFSTKFLNWSLFFYTWKETCSCILIAIECCKWITSGLAKLHSLLLGILYTSCVVERSIWPSTQCCILEDLSLQVVCCQTSSFKVCYYHVSHKA
jgi:hypothetical protein